MEIILYGAGGHSKVVLNSIRKGTSFKVVGFIDDRKTGTWANVPILGTGDSLGQLTAAGAVVTIGHNRTRGEKAALLQSRGFKLVAITDPGALVAEEVTVGKGTVVMPGAVINPGTRIGENVIINTGAVIEHDCSIEDGAHIAPGACLAGGVTIGAFSLVGIGAQVIEGIRVGSNAVVGAGAAVVNDVEEGTIVAGVPARPVGKST